MTGANLLVQDVRSIGNLDRASLLGGLARQALIAEAELTPKPGLVDRRGPGSHTDLSLEIMRRSASAIAPFFITMASVASGAVVDSDLRARIAVLGLDAEAAMLAATHGSNAHKGAIWILGLLVAAASAIDESSHESITQAAAYLAQIPHGSQLRLVTHGDVVRFRFGVRGARGEACDGFPHVVHIGLPALREARSNGLAETHSRLRTLLNIMAVLDDSCVLYRGGIAGSVKVKCGARSVLGKGGPGCTAGDSAMVRFDRELTEARLSPGGSADLLAATIFLDALERGLSEVEQDKSH
jgi:triphosphoribosyl-dephospho-CoA synthase